MEVMEVMVQAEVEVAVDGVNFLTK